MKADSENPLNTAPKHTDFLNQSTIMSHHNQDSSPPVPTPPSSHLRVDSFFKSQMFARNPPQPDPPHPNLHTPSWSSPVFTSVPAQEPSYPSMYPSTSSAHRPPIPSGSPVPPFHAPSPLLSGLRPNTSLRVPNTSMSRDHHTSESEDEESIESNQSGLAMIPPCTDYSRYSYWLKKNFPHLMTKPNMNFVENILEIRDFNTAMKFKMF
jgi:hypothetical protein